MTLIEMPNLVQGSDEWLAARRGIMTASIAGQFLSTRTLSAIDYQCPECGELPYSPCRSVAKGKSGPIKTLHPARSNAAIEFRASSPILVEVADNDTSRSAAKLLVSERITGWTEPTWISDDMARGNRDEPIARDLYSEHFAEATETGFMVREEDGIRIGYSPDGLVGDDGLIEIKSRRPKNQLATILADAVPLENVAQVQCGFFVSGRKWLDFISFAGGMPMYVKRVYPDPIWQDAINSAWHDFENNAAEMVATYQERTAGLPDTDRILELEMVI